MALGGCVAVVAIISRHLSSSSATLITSSNPISVNNLCSPSIVLVAVTPSACLPSSLSALDFSKPPLLTALPKNFELCTATLKTDRNALTDGSQLRENFCCHGTWAIETPTLMVLSICFEVACPLWIDGCLQFIHSQFALSSPTVTIRMLIWNLGVKCLGKGSRPASLCLRKDSDDFIKGPYLCTLWTSDPFWRVCPAHDQQWKCGCLRSVQALYKIISLSESGENL